MDYLGLLREDFYWFSDDLSQRRVALPWQPALVSWWLVILAAVLSSSAEDRLQWPAGVSWWRVAKYPCLAVFHQGQQLLR